MPDLVAIKHNGLDRTINVNASTAAMLKKHGGWKDAPKSEQPKPDTEK